MEALTAPQPIIENFIDIVEKGSKALISGESVIPSIQLIEECYENRTRFSMPWCTDVECLINEG